MEDVAVNWFNYIVGAATICAAIVGYLVYRHTTKSKPSPRTLQTMENSVDSTQTATRDDV